MSLWKAIKLAWKLYRSSNSKTIFWSLCDVITDNFLEGLYFLRYRGHGYPSSSTSEEWDKNLADMIDGFSAARAYLDWDYTSQEHGRDLWERFNKGWEIAGDHFFALWD